MISRELRSHVFLTYTNLRVGLGIIALAFPLVLWLGGKALGFPLQGSFCAYYHVPPMRNCFVGVLFAMASFLYLYKGFSWQEDYALNLAGVLAVLIAVFPMDPPSDGPLVRSPMHQLHNTFSISFLLILGYVCLFRSVDTLRLIEPRARARVYRYAYKLIGASMVVTPVAVYLMTSRHQEETPVFFVESAAVWAFSAYWLLKTQEINESLADQVVTFRKGKMGVNSFTPEKVELTPISLEKVELTPISPTSIALNCEKCGKLYEMPEALAGKRARCKQCGHEFRVPAPGVPQATLSRKRLN